MSPEIGLTYDECLSTLGLYSLEFRRMMRILIENYRIVNDLDRVNAERTFPLMAESRTEGTASA